MYMSNNIIVRHAQEKLLYENIKGAEMVDEAGKRGTCLFSLL